MTQVRQNPFPHEGLRICTFPGHEGPNPLPANEEHFPVRKSGPRAGSFVGWCHACQGLSAERYRAEPWRQGVRGSASRGTAAARTADQRFLGDLSGAEVVDLADLTRPSLPVPGPTQQTATSRSKAHEMRLLTPPPPGGRERPFLDEDETARSLQSWAASWYARLEARPESWAYLQAVTAWRAMWRPQRVRVLLVAESHVGEHPGDDRISVRSMRWINRTLPNRYVRLIYCLGYGEDEICTAPPQSNAGTPQFWNIFGQIALGQSPPAKTTTSLQNRLRWKVGVLEELAQRGIWLQDASPLGIYLGRGERLDPRHYTQLLQEGYRRFVWPTVADDKPEQVWVIGRGVYAAIAALPGIQSDRVISQPQDRNHARYLDGLRQLCLACAG